MSLRWRLTGVVAVLLLFGFLAGANFVPEERREAAWYWPDQGLRLGLDLRGGIHMVIGPDLEVAVRQELDHLRSSLERDLEEAELGGAELSVRDRRIVVEAGGAEDAQRVVDLLDERGYNVLEVTEQSEGRLRLALTGDWMDEVRERAMLQALEVLRRRVNDPATGIPESVVTRQGSDQILVQIPGVSRVPDIFQQTGFLEFKIVQDVAKSEELLRAKYEEGLPKDTEIVFERAPDSNRVVNAYLVSESSAITGEKLADARVDFNDRQSEWQVRFTWTAEGAETFGKLTEQNVGEPLAIILDGELYSAPRIRERISRSGVITGRFSAKEASDLAVILRAGSLPIPVRIEEERTIGPALGADSIRSGVWACAVGLLVVIAFVFGYYRLSGGYASVALLANLVLIVGLMSLFEGTLTLPGIAGLVLTVGMAVDANVIIFERVREELRARRAVRTAIAAGFQKARWTILDANITTLITAIVLYEYGTGPIQGFAVTLSVGIVTSVFSALVITRVLFQIYPGSRPVQQLSI